MRARLVTISIIANVVLTIWVVTLYVNKGSGGAGVEKIRAGAVRNEPAQPIGVNAGRSDDLPVALRGPRKISEMLPKSKYLAQIGTRPEIVLFDNSGELTTQAIEYAGLSESEVREAQTHYRAFRENLTKQFADHLKVDETRSKPDRGIYCYRVASFPEAGAGSLEEFAKNLDQSLDGYKRERLLSMMNIGSNYCGLGQYEVHLKLEARAIQNPNDPDEDRYYLSCELRDPTSGKVAGQRQEGLAEFERRIGRIFDFSSHSN